LLVEQGPMRLMVKRVQLERKHSGLARVTLASSAFVQAEFSRVATHPNILQLLDFYLVGASVCYFVFKVVDSDLETVLINKARDGQRLEEPWIARVIGEVALALDYLIHFNTAHNNVSPPNILLDSEESVRLTDPQHFGYLSAPPRAGKRQGVHYDAPEILLGDQPPANWKARKLAGAKADIWSLGCIMFEMAAGRPAFVEEEDGATVLYQIISTVGAPSPDEASHIKESIRRDLVWKYNDIGRDFTQFPVFKGCSEVFLELLEDMLRFSPFDRPSAAQVWGSVCMAQHCTLQQKEYHPTKLFLPEDVTEGLRFTNDDYARRWASDCPVSVAPPCLGCLPWHWGGRRSG